MKKEREKAAEAKSKDRSSNEIESNKDISKDKVIEEEDRSETKANRSKTEANRSKTEADRSETKANRSKTEANSSNTNNIALQEESSTIVDPMKGCYKLTKFTIEQE